MASRGGVGDLDSQPTTFGFQSGVQSPPQTRLSLEKKNTKDLRGVHKVNLGAKGCVQDYSAEYF